MIENALTAARAAKVGALVTAYAAHAAVGKAVIKDETRRKRFFIRNISRYGRRALETMNFEIEVTGYDRRKLDGRNFLIVSNHMSYADILVLSSVRPAMFVTSVDMGEKFFLGTMAELGGSIFVERRHRGQIERDLTTISQSLRDGFDVVIYPEGTSSNGEGVLPFKKSLLMAAVQAQVDILPIVVRYDEIDGEPFSPASRDKICWYGDMTFGPHFAGLMKLKSVKARLEFLEPLKVTPNSTRHELAERAYEAISRTYQGARRESR